MTGFVHSVDKNQKQMMKDLEQMGIQSRSVAGARGAGVDMICSCSWFPVNLLVEVKKPGERNDLRDSEKWMRDHWNGPWIVAERAEEIRDWFVAKMEGA